MWNSLMKNTVKTRFKNVSLMQCNAKKKKKKKAYKCQDMLGCYCMAITKR